MEPNHQLLFSLFFWLFVFPFCTCIDSITSNRSIPDGAVLLSKENTFALGFFSLGNSNNRYVGIWYHKIPGQTVVWVANRDNPINGSTGVLSINADGNLVLNDNRNPNVPIWSTNVSVSPTNINARNAKLSDSGDLVLEDDDTKRVIWRSFDHPSDTMLPGMKVGLDLKSGLNRFLTSWKSPEDPGTGEYSYKVDPRGSPQTFLYNGTTRTWRSPPWPWAWPRGGSTETAATYAYNYSFVNSEDEIDLAYAPNDASIITRIVLESAGLLHELTWHDADRQWKCFREAPTIPCEQYGHCGANSKCNRNSVNAFECTCLPGFEPSSPRDWYLRDGSQGCARKRAEANRCGAGEGFLKVAQVKLPDTTAAKTEKGWSVEACKEACLSNCSCTAYAMNIDGKISVCLTWYGGLNDTVEYADVGPDLYVRVDAIVLAENANNSRGFLRNKGKLATAILSLALAFFILVVLPYLWLMKKRNARVAKDELEESRDSPDLPCLDLSTIVAATDNFSSLSKLGQGGFGTVYKGQLSDGQEIAVKRLSKSSGQGMEEFKNEVTLIAKLQHRNLVKLLGSCIEGEERMLIYEYLPNKSLDSFIFDETRRLLLDWRKRFAIIVGVARGILYLHQDSRLRIIHRDLKSSNVLLDADMNPKISDFGMARIFRGDQIQDNTNRVVGTYGYMSPEYALFGKFSTKSDVFSFGVILLEIVSGKKNTCYSQDEPSMTLIGHVWELWREERALEILDSSLSESYLPQEALRCIHIGLLCVEESVTDRPTMLEVLLMLAGEATLPPPKQPAFVFRSICNGPYTSAAGKWPCSINEVTISDIQAR